MSQSDLSVAVVGGSIGGLAAALSLRHAGFEVQVFEQAAALGEAGAGIEIGPNAARLLHRWGLAEALDRTGMRPVAVHQRRWDDGRTLERRALGAAVETAFGAPYYQFQRADLLKVLGDMLPPERVHRRHRLIGFTEREDCVELSCANGARVRADVLVGADGIGSTVRAALFGPEWPHFTGCIAYRGLVPAERLAHLGFEVVSNIWMGPGGHVTHYFVAGGRLVDFVAVRELKTGAGESWTGESWTERGAVADAVAAFRGWHPQVRAMIEAVDEVCVWALFDRTPMPRWSVGRVTLLGDACHAMPPFLTQGAAQAIEDSATLAACLLQNGAADVPAALRRYEALRVPRVTRVQALARLERTRLHLPDGPEQQARDARMATSAERSIETMSWLYAHDASAVDAMGS